MFSKFFGVIFLFISLTTAAFAQGSNWSLTMSTVSRHAEHRKFNEFNPGLGVEYRFNQDFSVGGGIYRNSIKRNSIYINGLYTPIHIYDNDMFHVKGGIIGGVVNHYNMNNGNPILMAGGLVVMEGERWGVNLIVLPKVPKKTPWTVGVQLKMRF